MAIELWERVVAVPVVSITPSPFFIFAVRNVFSSRHPANICWSSRHVLKMSPTRLQRNNFSSSKKSWRRLAITSWRHVLKTSGRHVLNTSWRHVLKAFGRHVLKTFSRSLGDKKKWEYLYLTNLNVCVSNKFIFHKSISDEFKANPKSLIRTK